MRGSSKIIVGVTLLSLMLITSLSILIGPHLPSVPFEEIHHRDRCDITVRSTYVISENESWAELWTNIHNRSFSGVPTLPSVDFTTDLIFAVFQGWRPTLGYTTTITKIVLGRNGYVVYVDEVHPNDGIFPAVSQPYHIVKISNFPQDVPAYFVYNIIIDYGF